MPGLIVSGDSRGALVARDGRGAGFLPDGMRFRWNPIGVELSQGFLACWSCGHVWGNLRRDELRASIEKYGKESTRQYCDAVEHGPAHGLPDCPEAIEAARGATEIDGLILMGGRPEATRRFRELTQTTWDEALAVIRGWDDLAREKKLALLGWAPKDKPGPEESAMLDHPLRDRLLDG